jgi:signal transduction histidine kinase
MLGHDMRTPLQTVLSTAQLLAKINADAQVSNAAQRLIDSGKRIKVLLDDLLDFGRTRLGLGIRVTPHAAELSALFASELEQVRTVYPDRDIALHCLGDCSGCWDGVRLQQLLENLVVNAIKYGDPGSPVEVSVHGERETVVFEVRNAGPAIEPRVLEAFFDPLKRGAAAGSNDDGLGLGLYIAREVARAHGGDITASSRAGETNFRCTLPRRA